MVSLTKMRYYNHMAKDVVEITKKIAMQLRIAIAKKDIAPSNQWIADQTGITSMTIGRYLKGERDIPMPSFIAICAALELDPAVIMRLALEQ